MSPPTLTFLGWAKTSHGGIHSEFSLLDEILLKVVSCWRLMLEAHSTCIFCSLCSTKQTSRGRLSDRQGLLRAFKLKLSKPNPRNFKVGVARQGVRRERTVRTCWLCLSHASPLWSLGWFCQSPKPFKLLQPAFCVGGESATGRCVWDALCSLPYPLSMSRKCFLYWATQGTSWKRCVFWSCPVPFSWEMGTKLLSPAKTMQNHRYQGSSAGVKTQTRHWMSWKKDSEWFLTLGI